ncbi:hypothetical protein SLA2020_427890 [Shorea laevis]
MWPQRERKRGGEFRKGVLARESAGGGGGGLRPARSGRSTARLGCSGQTWPRNVATERERKRGGVSQGGFGQRSAGGVRRQVWPSTARLAVRCGHALAVTSACGQTRPLVTARSGRSTAIPHRVPAVADRWSGRSRWPCVASGSSLSLSLSPSLGSSLSLLAWLSSTKKWEGSDGGKRDSGGGKKASGSGRRASGGGDQLGGGNGFGIIRLRLK